MKYATILFLAILNLTCLIGQDLYTSGENSPAVIAKNFSAIYGVRTDAIKAILWIYETEGYDEARRKRATEQILREYTQSPEKKQKADELSTATRQKMGITNAPEIAKALEWDLFARSHYLSTTGPNSPAVVAKGDVNIWYGIPPKALRALATQLEKNKTDLSKFETQLTEQVKKYEELKTELETYGAKEEIYQQAEALLEEGKLEEAERLIESDFEASMKRQAYKGYIYGKTKGLLLKYDEAAKGYRNAVNNAQGNSTYHLYYAYNENTLAHYNEAIRHYEIALSIDSLQSDNEERIAILLNNLGEAWYEKGDYDIAIGYYEKALKIFLAFFGDYHPNVAIDYNNLGSVWDRKGDYDIAIAYFKKALKIDLKAFGDQHPNVATRYNNLGAAWDSKGDHDKAIAYFKKALKIDLKAFGKQYPNVARDYNNLGEAWRAKGDYYKAIEYYENALKIFLAVFGVQHPNVATGYNNLGLAWYSIGNYDKAIEYYENALKILLAVFDDHHHNVASGYNNLGEAKRAKGDYEIAIAYFEKALQIDLKLFGEQHPNVANRYNNLGSTSLSKGEYKKAFDYYEKALQINLNVFGDQHPSVAANYNNLASVWHKKEEYITAIGYYEKCQEILNQFFPITHPYQKSNAQNLSNAANSRGMELFNEKKYQEALGYFQKALQNAEKAQDDVFSLTCLINVGSMQKQLELYKEGLQSLDEGLEKAALINLEIDENIKKQMTPKMLENREVQNQIAAMRNLNLIRRMRYHKVGCLKGLNQNEEADTLAKQLWQEGIDTNDARLLEDLKKEDYDFGN